MSTSIDWRVLSLQLVTTFAHFLWQGAVIGVVLAVVLRLCVRRSANTRYVTACVAFVLLPVCVVGTFAAVHRNGEAVFLESDDAQQPRQASLLVDQTTEPPLLSRLISPIDANDERTSIKSMNVPSQSADAEPADRTWSDLLSVLSPYLFGMYLWSASGCCSTP